MATDPARRLEPVIRLAPAKVNLTLAVLGHPPRRLPRPPQRDGPARPRGPPRRCRVAAARRRRTRLHVDGLRPGARRRQPRPAGDRRRPPRRRGRSGAAASRRRPSPPAWRSGSRSPPGWPAARRTPPPRPTRRSRPGAWTLDDATRHRLAAELGSDVPFFLAGGPALVEGRGERVTPLRWLRDADPAGRSPGPAAGDARRAAISTPAAFAAWDAGARLGRRRRAPGVGAPRRRAPRRGCASRTCWPGRRVLAAANDLAPAAAIVEPGLVPFKRALLRLLARPVGLSGLRPHPLGALSFACRGGRGRRRASARRIAAGELPAPGPREPFVAADPHPAAGKPADPGRQP